MGKIIRTRDLCKSNAGKFALDIQQRTHLKFTYSRGRIICATPFTANNISNLLFNRQIDMKIILESNNRTIFHKIQMFLLIIQMNKAFIRHDSLNNKIQTFNITQEKPFEHPLLFPQHETALLSYSLRASAA